MPLNEGIVLPGVTRKSLMDLAQSWGEFKVVERVLTMQDIITAVDNNRVCCFLAFIFNHSVCHIVL